MCLICDAIEILSQSLIWQDDAAIIPQQLGRKVAGDNTAIFSSFCSSSNCISSMLLYLCYILLTKIMETFHEPWGCSNKRNIRLCNILFVFVQYGKENISGNNLSYIEHYTDKGIRIMSINVLRLWKMNLDNEFHVVTKYLQQSSFTTRKLIWIILTVSLLRLVRLQQS